MRKRRNQVINKNFPQHPAAEPVINSLIAAKSNQCSMAPVVQRQQHPQSSRSPRSPHSQRSPQRIRFQGSVRCKTVGSKMAKTRRFFLGGAREAAAEPWKKLINNNKNENFKNFVPHHPESVEINKINHFNCGGGAGGRLQQQTHPEKEHPPHFSGRRRRRSPPGIRKNRHHPQQLQETQNSGKFDLAPKEHHRQQPHHRPPHHHKIQQIQNNQKIHKNREDVCSRPHFEKFEKTKSSARLLCDLTGLRQITACDKFVNNASETYSIYGPLDRYSGTVNSRIFELKFRRSSTLASSSSSSFLSKFSCKWWPRGDFFTNFAISMLIIHIFTVSTVVSGSNIHTTGTDNGALTADKNQTFHLAAITSISLMTSSASSLAATGTKMAENENGGAAVSNAAAAGEGSPREFLGSGSGSESGSGSGSSPSPGLASFITRENAIRREPNLSSAPGGCHTCRLREQVKADNLASIKRHILLRLEMKTLPNVSSPIVPREIIEKFYKTQSFANRMTPSATGGGGGGSRQQRPPNLQTSASYDSMQGDDPRIYVDYPQNSEENSADDFEEEFFSVVNSLYVFPTVARMRHNRKPDILHFSFTNNGHSSVSQAILHVYIWGRDHFRDIAETSQIENIEIHNRQEIVFTINRVLRRQNSPNSTHTQKVSEVRQQIPSGRGKWIDVDVTEMVTNWFNNPNTNHGLVIKTSEPWMKPLVVTEEATNSKEFALYIEIQTKDNRKRRTKRNTSLNCSGNDNEERCCRYPLVVDFQKFDWDWILAPSFFAAYFCNGECQMAFLPKYPHTHIMQLSAAPQPCCSPTKMSPLKLLHYNNDQVVVMSTIPNMVVDKCSCS